MITFFVGAIFTLGLGFGGMLQRAKIVNFLTMSDNWDPQLLILFCSAVGFNVLSFHYIINKKKIPVFAEKMELPTNKNIDFKLIFGSVIFGIGWGLGGLCPGPALNLYP